MVKACGIDDCGGTYRVKRGLCSPHYQKLLKHGDPLAGVRRYSSPEEAFLARTEPLLWSGCLIWTGASDPRGYGQISVDGRTVLAHRFAYEQEYGPITDGKQIDHRYHCEPACCEPTHLREATHAQNMANRGRTLSRRDLPRGVRRSGDRFAAEVAHEYLGLYETSEEASAVASARRRERYGEFAGRD